MMHDDREHDDREHDDREHDDREHVDSDLIALLAMGEPGTPDADVRHVASCAECAAEMRELRHIVELGRSAGESDGSLPGGMGPGAMPRDEVWTRISTTLGLSGVVPASFGGGTGGVGSSGMSGHTAHSSTADGSDLAAPTHTTPPAPLSGHTEPPAATLGDTGSPVGLHAVSRASGSESTARVPADSRPGAEGRAQRRWLPPLLGAAAIVLVVGGIAGGLAMRQGPPAEVLAQAQLAALPDWDGATGRAVVEVDDEGGRSVVVALQDGTPNDGYREVWLISDDLTELVSIGVLEGEDGRFVIPSGIDLDVFPIVDVSEEPLDGDPAHSGNSIVRGTLES